MKQTDEIDEANAKAFDWSNAYDPWDWDEDVYTGTMHVTHSFGPETRARLVIEQDEPLPMTLLFIDPEVEVN